MISFAESLITAELVYWRTRPSERDSWNRILLDIRELQETAS